MIKRLVLITLLILTTAQYAFASQALDQARETCIGQIEDLKAFADKNLKEHKSSYNEYVKILSEISTDLINRIEDYNSIIDGLPAYEQSTYERKYAKDINKFCNEQVRYAQDLNKELTTELNKMGRQPTKKKSESLLDQFLDFIANL